MGSKTSDGSVMNRNRWRSRRGSAFVLLSMLFVSLFVAAVIITEGSGRNAAMQTAEAAYHLAGRSILSMYDRQLEERYGLLGVQNDNAKLKGWLQEYGNTTVTSNTLVRADSRVVAFDTAGFSLEDPRIMMYQVRVLGTVGLIVDGMEDLVSECGSLGDLTESVKNLEKRQESMERDLDRQEEAAAEDEDNDIDFGEIRRIHSQLKRKKAHYEKEDEDSDPGTADHVLRNKEIINDLPTVENNIMKHGFFSTVGNLTEMAIGKKGYTFRDGIKATQYAFDHFRHHQSGIDEGDQCFFDNELEYIIFGDYSDNENYKSAYRTIRTIRYASNMLFISTDSGMRSKTLSMAEALTPGPWAKLTQMIIACAWAAYETHNDMRNIEEGYSVPIVKTRETWMTDLDSLVNDSDTEHDFIICQENGVMKYPRYLQMIMMMEATEDRLYRMMDLIQINMKGTVRGDFVLEDHIAGFSMTVQVNKENLVPGLAAAMRPFYVNQVHMFVSNPYRLD